MTKIGIALFCLIVLVVSDPIYTSRAFVSGDAANWTQYSPNGISQTIDYSALGLTKTPAISTSLTCVSGCWAVTGVTSYYNLGPTSFIVYLRFPIEMGNLTVALATSYQFSLKYIIFPK